MYSVYLLNLNTENQNLYKFSNVSEFSLRKKKIVRENYNILHYFVCVLIVYLFIIVYKYIFHLFFFA